MLRPGSNVLEIASGTGEHAVFFASELEFCRWIPSDIDPLAQESIIAWRDAIALENLDPPLLIDVTQQDWQQQISESEIDVIVNINMIHIAPWQACLGLMSGAGKILPPGKGWKKETLAVKRVERS